MIHKPLGEELFYPSDSKILKSMIDSSLQRSSGPVKDCRVIIIPHGWYDRIIDVLSAPWSAVSSFKAERIILLLPVHATDGQICSPGFSQLNSPLGSQPALPFPDIPGDTHLYLEEPALDNPLPFITTLFPDIPVQAIFVPGCSSSAAKRLSALLKHYDTPRSLYVISSNSSGELRAEEAERQARRLASLLTSPEKDQVHSPILEPFARQEISPCNPLSIEALRRTGILTGPYRAASYLENPVTGTLSLCYAGYTGLCTLDDSCKNVYG